MKTDSFYQIIQALEAANVRYLVAGGLAVGAHGHLRYTKDADIVADLTSGNIAALFGALATLGYRPLVPVTAAQFGDAVLREAMIREKGMQVLQFFSDRHRETPVDVFVQIPFVFDEEYPRALSKPFATGAIVRFVSLPTLIRMKEIAGRTQDLLDVAQLRAMIDDDEPSLP